MTMMPSPSQSAAGHLVRRRLRFSCYQHTLADALLDLYGDVLGAGRSTTLQQEIERVMLAWLRGQPKESNFLLPLLETVHAALCNAPNPQRQEGASHLIASLVPDLPGCPAAILQAVLPASQNVADYAFIALHLLDAND